MPPPCPKILWDSWGGPADPAGFLVRPSFPSRAPTEWKYNDQTKMNYGGFLSGSRTPLVRS